MGQEDPLEKGMATHSSLLAWRTPWTEEPGGLVHGVAKSWTRLSNFHFTSHRSAQKLTTVKTFIFSEHMWTCLLFHRKRGTF